MEEKDLIAMNRGRPERMDPFASAPPGHSLTQDNSKWPWGQAPQQVDPEEVLERAIAALSKPKTMREMFKLLIVGVSIEVLVEGYLFAAFQEGKFTPDVAALIKPALAFYIADMAEEEGIPYRLFENDDVLDEGEMDDETFFRMMKDNNPRMFAYIQETVNSQIRQGMAPREPREENFLSLGGKD